MSSTASPAKKRREDGDYSRTCYTQKTPLGFTFSAAVMTSGFFCTAPAAASSKTSTPRRLCGCPPPPPPPASTVPPASPPALPSEPAPPLLPPLLALFLGVAAPPLSISMSLEKRVFEGLLLLLPGLFDRDVDGGVVLEPGRQSSAYACQWCTDHRHGGDLESLGNRGRGGGGGGGKPEMRTVGSGP